MGKKSEKGRQEEEEEKEEEKEHKAETILEKHTKGGERSPRLSPEPTEKEATFALASLSTPIKSKRKRQRKTPLYFKTRRSISIKQGKP